jgi:hypothetical protein
MMRPSEKRGPAIINPIGSPVGGESAGYGDRRDAVNLEWGAIGNLLRSNALDLLTAQGLAIVRGTMRIVGE